MKTSARNALRGVVSDITPGAVNSEVTLKVADGVEIVSVVTRQSVEDLAKSVKAEFGKGGFDVVHPSLSILTEFPVAIVERTVDKKGTRKQAQAYLEYLWSKEGQENAAQNYLRPRDPEVLKKYAAQFPAINTFTVDEVFGGWSKAFPAHFKDGGSFDQIYQAK